MDNFNKILSRLMTVIGVIVTTAMGINSLLPEDLHNALIYRLNPERTTQLQDKLNELQKEHDQVLSTIAESQICRVSVDTDSSGRRIITVYPPKDPNPKAPISYSSHQDWTGDTHTERIQSK